jgi:hypothetical protein
MRKGSNEETSCPTEGRTDVIFRILKTGERENDFETGGIRRNTVGKVNDAF